jgi:hypothetical protein
MRFATAAYLILVLAACGTHEPTPPRLLTAGGGEAVETDVPLSLDEAFLWIGGLAPAFAGAFTTDRSLTIVVTNLEDSAAVRKVVEESIRRADEFSDLQLLTGRTSVDYQKGHFTWADLFRWRRSFDDRMPAGTIATDIDESNNIITAAVTDEATKAAADAIVTAIGIPPAALTATVGRRMLPLVRSQGNVDSLQGYVRPTLGGVQVVRRFTVGGGVTSGTCTLGANVVKVGSPDLIFLTNSHCTKELFELDGTAGNPTWYQPDFALSGPLSVPIATSDRTDPVLFPVGRARPAKSAAGAMLPS